MNSPHVARYLVINSGSSTLKYAVFNAGDLSVEERGNTDITPDTFVQSLEAILHHAGQVAAVGHRVVHGGERFTAPVAGVYLFQVTISSIWGMGTTDGGVIQLLLYKNGSNYDEFGRIDCATGVDFQNLFNQIYMSGTIIENAAADDYYEVFGYNGTGATISFNYTQGYASFQGVLIG